MQATLSISQALADVKYEIRGHLSRRAYELERQDHLKQVSSILRMCDRCY